METQYVIWYRDKKIKLSTRQLLINWIKLWNIKQSEAIIKQATINGSTCKYGRNITKNVYKEVYK